MSDLLSSARRRLSQTANFIMGKTQDPNSIPWNPDNTSFPSRKDLPRIPGAPEGCAWVWGKEDYLGRLNLLTPTRVKAAAAEIKTGEMVRLDLPLNIPEQPSFHRETFTHRIKALVENIAYDDIYTLNTQSGTQWDGFRHVAHVPTTTFYNNTKASDFTGEKDNLKCSIHHWSDHGFTGRACKSPFPRSGKSIPIWTPKILTHANKSPPRLPHLRDLPRQNLRQRHPPRHQPLRAQGLRPVARPEHPPRVPGRPRETGRHPPGPRRLDGGLLRALQGGERQTRAARPP